MKRAAEEFLDLVRLLPEPEELLKRAKVFAAIEKNMNRLAGFYENYNDRHSDRYYWEDGGGQEANIIFKADEQHNDSILMFAYDHESSFNTYSSEEDQIAFDFLPEALEPLLEEEYLKWNWDKSEKRIVYATVAIWREHGDNDWKFSPTLFSKFTERDEDGGFSYAFKRFILPMELGAISTLYNPEDLENGLEIVIEEALEEFTR
jgi:hypothetical protein